MTEDVDVVEVVDAEVKLALDVVDTELPETLDD